MRPSFLYLLIVTTCLTNNISAQPEKLMYHVIKTDPSGKILPWYSDEPGKAYSYMINLIWNFWDTMRVDMNGVPYYMNHQVWAPGANDPRGLGGDQIQMALSSWRLLYAYTGNERVKENMRFLADYYLTHSLSPADGVYSHIPYPYNTLIYSGYYDGDMILGKGFTQPDKAGSFGIELLQLYKMITKERYPHASDKAYLEAVIKIADALAKNTVTGDENNSPLPFKVNAITGEVGELRNNRREKIGHCSYTTNWAGTLEMFLELQKLNVGNKALYAQAFDRIMGWMKTYPLKNNRWGPFFEDIPGWSDTQINAITFAQFIMNHQEYFPEWRKDVQGIFDWVYAKLGNENWKKYGVTVVNEQTAYQTPGNSHTSRQASAELQYMALTGDHSRSNHAVWQLNWATYMVDDDGKNRYPQDDVWLTDGYGDYVRHYLRAMSVMPELSPSDEEHILSSTSVIQQADYWNNKLKFITHHYGKVDPSDVRLYYRTFDGTGMEEIRLNSKPSAVRVNDQLIMEIKDTNTEGFMWKPLQKGGLLTIVRKNGYHVVIMN